MDHTFLMGVMEANEKVEHTSDTQVLLHMKEQYLSKHEHMHGAVGDVATYWLVWVEWG